MREGLEGESQRVLHDSQDHIISLWYGRFSREQITVGVPVVQPGALEVIRGQSRRGNGDQDNRTSGNALYRRIHSGGNSRKVAISEAGSKRIAPYDHLIQAGCSNEGLKRSG